MFDCDKNVSSITDDLAGYPAATFTHLTEKASKEDRFVQDTRYYTSCCLIISDAWGWKDKQ